MWVYPASALWKLDTEKSNRTSEDWRQSSPSCFLPKFCFYFYKFCSFTCNPRAIKRKNSPYLTEFHQPDLTHLRGHICCDAAPRVCVSLPANNIRIWYRRTKRDTGQHVMAEGVRRRVLVFGLRCSEWQGEGTASKYSSNLARKGSWGPVLTGTSAPPRARFELGVKTDLCWQQPCALHGLFDK